MKFRLVTLIGFVAAVTAIAVTTNHLTLHYPPAVHKMLVPRSASYLGVFEPGAPPGYEPVTDFARMADQQPNLVGYYSGWAQPFNTSFADRIASHDSVPYVQIDPKLASVSGIATGAYDTYLRSYADSVRDFGHAVVIGFGHEMNGDWYSWGYHHTSPVTFVAAWRHIVNVFRAEGAFNVTWLWTINQDRRGTGPIARWWPGARYVTWIGVDGYYVRPSDTFYSVFGRTIKEVQAFSNKPVLLSETAVAPRAGQFADILNLFHGMQQYGALGLVWFDQKQSGTPYRQDWRLEGKPHADVAFRVGVRGLKLVHS